MWLKQQAWPIGILIALVAATFIVLKLSASYRNAVLSRRRRGMTEQTFVEGLARYNFDPVIAGTTYRYLREVQQIKFPILPSDALDEDLGLDPDDVDQMIHDLLRSLHREEVPGLRNEPILTVEGLVRHLQASPRRKYKAAA
jgi:hypothetical protein